MYVSVLGDSISTFKGYQPAKYPTFYDAEQPWGHDLSSVCDMWWAQVNRYLRAYICVNNAYSGSTVSGAYPSASSPERTGALHLPEQQPDIILIYMGFNDFARGIPPAEFEQAYGRMLTQLRQNYPRAWVFCGTLMRTFIRGAEQWVFPEKFGGTPLSAYNDAIRAQCAECSCELAELSGTGLYLETLDGTHPATEGHRTLAQAWIRCLRREVKVTPGV